VAPNRLEPLDAYTEEQLDFYPIGTEVECRVIREKNTWRKRRERRYRAILSLAVKQCKTPWQNSDEASDALKIALGVVDQGATISGGPIRYPRSLTAIDDSEFASFYEGAMALLYKITGVDPDTLRKEAGLPADDDGEPGEDNEQLTGDQLQNGNDASEPADAGLPAEVVGDGGGQTVDPNGRAPKPAVAALPVADAEKTINKPTVVSASAAATDSLELEREAVRKLVALARDPDTTLEEKLAELDRSTVIWTEALPNRAGFIKTLVETSRRVARGELQGPSASAYLHSLVGQK